MKKRLDVLEARLMSAERLSPEDNEDIWADAPADILDAVERLEAVAASYPQDLHPTEIMAKLGATDAEVDDIKLISSWIGRKPKQGSEKCTPEVTL